MLAQLVPAIGCAFLVGTGALAFYYWRRSSSLYALLVEGANRFEEVRQQTSNLEVALAKSEEKAKQQREAERRANQATDENRVQIGSLTQRLEAKERELHQQTEKLELQKLHLERQLAKREETLRVTAEQLTGTQEQATQWQRECAAASAELNLRENDFKSRLLELEKDKAASEKRAKAADPAELKRLKRRIAQFDRLYSSMKGLREMAEERNRNWEVALRKFAVWIIEENSGKTAAAKNEGQPIPQAIGPLVGLALHVIGAQLLDEDELADATEPQVAAAGAAAVGIVSAHASAARLSGSGAESVDMDDLASALADAARLFEEGSDTRTTGTQRPET